MVWYWALLLLFSKDRTACELGSCKVCSSGAMHCWLTANQLFSKRTCGRESNLKSKSRGPSYLIRT